jgi:hypothetical protein
MNELLLIYVGKDTKKFLITKTFGDYFVVFNVYWLTNNLFTI